MKNPVKTVKDWFTGEGKKPLTDEEKKKQREANPTNVRVGAQTVKEYRKKREDLLKEMDK